MTPTTIITEPDGAPPVTPATTLAPPRRRRALRDAWALFVESRYGPVGLVILSAIVLAAVFAPVIAPIGPFALEGSRFMPIGTPGHPLGTDAAEIFDRLVALWRSVYGSRVW